MRVGLQSDRALELGGGGWKEVLPRAVGVDPQETRLAHAADDEVSGDRVVREALRIEVVLQDREQTCRAGSGGTGLSLARERADR